MKLFSINQIRGYASKEEGLEGYRSDFLGKIVGAWTRNN